MDLLFLYMYVMLKLLTAGQDTVNVPNPQERTCSQSSTYTSNYWNHGPPCNAANGDTNGTISGSNCIHTGLNDREPYWEVDLGRTFPVSIIKVWGRTGYDQRLYPFTIAVDNQTCATVSTGGREHTVTCSEVLYGRVVRLTRGLNSDHTLQLCELQVLVNVANTQERTCNQSSTFNFLSADNWNHGPPCNAANGDTSGTMSGSNCIHTDPKAYDREPHWEVDLGRTFSVSTIKVWGRTHWAQRLYPFNITVDDELCATAITGDREHTVTCSEVLHGQVVRLTREYKTNDFSLDLCELQVFVTAQCRAGYHGHDCNTPCSGKCGGGQGSTLCQKFTGNCYGCVAGYYGDQCASLCNSITNTNNRCTGCTQDGQCTACDGNHQPPGCSDMCPYNVITDPISQHTYEVPATELGKAYISPHICLSNGEPYVTLLCQRDELHGASWSRFQPNQGCNFTDVVTSNTTDSLRNISLSEISMETDTDVINRTLIVLSNCEDCVELDIVYVADIMQGTARLDNISQETGQKVLELVDTITEVNSTILRGSNTIGNATNRIITAIEDIGGRIVVDNDTNEVLLVSKTTAVGVWDLSEVTDNLAVGMELVQGGQFLPTLARDDLEPLSEYVSPTYNRTDAAIFLQGRFIRNITDNDPGKDVRLTIVVFHDTALFRHGRLETSGDLHRNSKTVLNSKVISATITVDGVKITDLGNDVVTTVYSPINVPDESRGEKSLCVFWDPAGSKGAGAWSRDGCIHTSTLQDRDVCECSHLTNFAILLDLYGQDALLDAVHQTALSVITIIGLSLSIAGLSVTVLCFLLIKKLRQGRTQQTQFHRAVSMLGSWVVFLAGFRQAESGASCIAVAAMLHYLILVSFMWMMMEGLLQYLLLVKVFGVGFENYILKTAAVAWSLPLIPVVTILAIDTDLYHGGDQYCWMSLTPFYYAFLAPVAIIMLINIVFYVLVIYNICRRRNIGSSGTTNRAVGIRASVICFIALGLSWTFAFFAIGDARLVFQYLFTLTSTLQGFLVFLAFTARDPSVRAYWTRLHCRWGQNPTDTKLTTRTKGSREPDLGGGRSGSGETAFGGRRSNAHSFGESQGSVGLSHNSP